MTSMPYASLPDDQLLQHSSHPVHLVRDQPRDIELDVLAASGDACVTLATRLDRLVADRRIDDGGRDELERVIQALLYLQQYYAFHKKAG